MSRFRRGLRRLALALAGAVCLLALALGGLALGLATEAGRRLAAGWAGTLLSDAQQTVRIGEIGPGLPDVLRLRDFSVSDATGTWLAVDAARLDWRPTALLRGRLAVRALEVGTVTLARLPDAEAQPGRDFALPRFRLPVDIEVTGFHFAEIGLAAAVLGTEARLRVEGELLAEAGGEVRGRFRARRLDETPATADLDLAYDPIRGRLAVTAHAEEAAGGLLPTLIDMPEAPFSLRLEGDGDLAAWRGRLDVAGGARRLVGLDFTAAAAAGFQVSAKGRADLSRPLPELGAEPLEVDLMLASDDGRRWRVQAARLGYPWASAVIEGDIALTPAPRLALAFEASAVSGQRAPALPSDVHLDGLTAKGRVDGPLDALQAEFALAAESAAAFGVQARRLSAEGEAAGAADNLDLRLSFAAADLAYEDVAVRGLRGEARLDGSLAAPVANIRLNVAELRQGESRGRDLVLAGRIDGPLVQPSADLTLTLAEATHQGSAVRTLRLALQLEPGGMLDLDGEAAEFVIADDPLPALPKSPLRFAARGRFDPDTGIVEARTLRLVLPTMKLAGSGGYELASGEAAFAGEAGLAELASLRPLVGLPLAGETDLHLSLRRRGDGVLRGTVAGRFRALQTGLPEAGLLLGTSPGYAADWRLDGDGRLSLSALALDGKAGAVTGKLALSPRAERIEADLQADLPDAAVLAPVVGVAVQGRARLQARLAGALASPETRLEIRLDDAEIEGRPLGTVSAHAEAGGPFEALAGSFRLRIEPQAGPLVLATRFRRQDRLVLFDELKLEGKGLSGGGDVRLDTSTGRAAGSLKLRLDELAPWAKLAGVAASGALGAEISLAARGDLQAIEGSARLGDFRVTPADGRPLSGERLQLRLATVWPAGDAGGRLELDGQNLHYAEAALARLSVVVVGNLQAAEFSVDGTGRWEEAVSLAAAGRLTRQAQVLRLDLNRLQVTGFDQALTLERPARLTLLPKGFEVSDFAARLARGRIAVDGRADVMEVDIHAEGQALSLAPLSRFGLEAEGSADFKVRLRGGWPDPAGSAEVALAGLRLKDAGNLPPASGRLGAEWRGGRFAFSGEVDAGAGAPLRLEGALPLSVDAAPWRLTMPRHGTVEGRLSWAGSLDRLWALVPLPEHRLKGRMAADLRLSGTAGDPVIEGALDITEAEYEHLRFGTLLRNLEISLSTDGGRKLRLAKLSASDGEGGRLNGSGEVRLDDLGEPSFEAKLALRDFLALRRDDVTARVDADLSLTGDLRQAAAKGVITTRHVEARVDNTLSSNVVELNVIEVGGSDGTKAAKDRARERHLAVLLDLAVRVPGQAFLRGRGLDSEWAGELAITGTTAKPQVAGRLHSVRGSFSVLGKVFKLRDSTVAVATREGQPDALLDISAINSRSDLDVIVEASGWASAPKLEWRSVPALPRDEILSRLLFDKGTGQLTAFEAVQLASAVAELSGSGGGSLLDTLRGAIGVDTLRLSGEGETGAKLEAGKYLSEQVYIGVQQGAAGGSSGARIELQVLPNISIESEVEATGGANVGAKFKWDY